MKYQTIRTMKKIIIVQHLFGSTTAKTQRMMAAAKTYKKEGYNVVFIISLEQKEDLPDSEYKFVIIDEVKQNKFKCFRQFVAAIKKEYDSDSIILFDGAPVYSFLFNKKKFNVFSEITEIPFFGQKPTLYMRILEWFRSFGSKHFSGIMVISNSLKKHYESKGYPKIEVINMFVDLSRFEDLNKTIGHTTKYIGYCGRISTYKDGVHDLIKAFSVFSKLYPQYQLMLMGGFENADVEKQLKQQIKDENIEGKVVFTGVIDATTLPQMLFDAEILALARPNNRQAQYGFPTKLGEYLATGNPVVATKVGDIPEFLHNGCNAYLAEPDNYISFASSLIKCANNEELSRQIGKNGKKLAFSEFSSVVQSQKALAFMTANLTS